MLGCEDAAAPDLEVPVLQPDEFCGDYPDDAIATFVERQLETSARFYLDIGEADDLTCAKLSQLEVLTFNDAPQVTSLLGLQNLTHLRILELPEQSINDIGPISPLTEVRLLWLGGNRITDLGPWGTSQA